MVSDPAKEELARAIHKAHCTNPGCGPPRFYYPADYKAAELAVSVLAPLIRQQAFNEAAEALEAEANRKPKGLREHVAIHSFVNSRDWLAYAAALVRGLGEKENA